MKNVMMALLISAFALPLAAQPVVSGPVRGGSVRGGKVVAPRVIVVQPAPRFYNPAFAYGYGYNPWMYNAWNNPWNNPWAPNANQLRNAPPTQLDLQVEEINNQYAFEIDNVKANKAVDRAERRQRVRELKFEREQAIIDAKKQYYNRKKGDSADS